MEPTHLRPTHLRSPAPFCLWPFARLDDYDRVTQIRLEERSNTAHLFLTDSMSGQMRARIATVIDVQITTSSHFPS